MFSRTKKITAITLLSALVCSSLFSAALMAAENTQTSTQSIDDIRDPFYIGLGAGISFLNPELTNAQSLTISKDSDFAYKIFAGYQFTDNWAAEFFWSDLGQAEISSQTSVIGIAEYQSFGVGGLYQYPISDSWDVFATAGVGRLRNSFQKIGADRVEDSFIYAGGGVMWNVANTWGLRAEYDYYDTDAQMLSLNIVKRFGSATPKRIARLENKVQQQDEKLAAMTTGLVATSTAKKQNTCDDYAIELKGVVFAKRSVDLTEKSKQILNTLAEKLITLPQDINFEVRAHTDDKGTELYNYTLSLMRARNVRDYLAASGIALSRIEAQGYGEWRPVQSNKTQAGRDANRRAELVLLGVEKHVADTNACPTLAAP